MLLYTFHLDRPALEAAMQLLHWSFADVAAAAGLPEQRVRELATGLAHDARSVRRVQQAINDGFARRGG